jgi:hypothetical protein
LVAQSAGPPPHPQLLLAGTVPPLADAYYQRPETGLALRGGLYPGDTVVLTHDEEAEPAARGGTGKTQLAVAYAHALWSLRTVEVLVWVTATNRAAIITSFAEAATMVSAEDRGLTTETAALQFVAWLARSRRPWALVIDDLDDPDAMANLWPAGPTGQVVITTPRPDLRPPGPGVRIAPVGGFNRREALSYLSARLTDFPDQRTEALELGEDLAGLAVSLAQAAGVMKTRGLSCREYRVQFAERRGHVSGVQVDGVGATVLARARGAGLARPGADRHVRPPWRPRRRADQPGRVRLYRRPAQYRHRERPGHGPLGHHQPSPGRAGQHRRRQRCPHGTHASVRPGRRPRVPAAG